MHNIGRLLNILQTAEDIIRDSIAEGANDITERIGLISGIAISELVKEGMPYRISENGAYIIETDGHEYIYERPNAKSAKVKNIKEKDGTPSAAKEPAPDNAEPEDLDAKAAPVWFHEEVQNDENTSEPKAGTDADFKAEEADNDSADMGIISISEEETVKDSDDDMEVQAAAHEEPSVEATEVTEAVSDEGDTEYPTFLHRDDFMFEYRRIVIRDNMDKKICSVEFVSTPLNPDDPESPALLWAQHGKDAFTITVEPRTRQKIEVENVPFYYSFSYVDGEFKSEVDLTNNYKQINYRIQEREYQNFNGKGHIIIADGDIKVHIMPLTFYNNNTHGNAEFMYCVESDNGTICGETNGADHCEADLNGLTLSIMSRWEQTSNILYAQVSG